MYASVEVVIEELQHPVARFVGGLAVVFHPVAEQYPAGLEARVIETMVRTGIDDLFDGRPLSAPI